MGRTLSWIKGLRVLGTPFALAVSTLSTTPVSVASVIVFKIWFIVPAFIHFTNLNFIKFLVYKSKNGIKFSDYKER